MKPLKYNDLKTLRKIERCLTNMIPQRKNHNIPKADLAKLKHMLTNAKELREFFKMMFEIPDEALQVEAALEAIENRNPKLATKILSRSYLTPRSKYATIEKP